MMTALLAGQPGSWDSVPGRVEICIFYTACRLALGLSHAPAQWVLLALSLGAKQRVHEADHSTLSSVEIMNVWSHFTISSWLSH
jgi:hypothetical protein